ncbi:hypothetical protein ABCS02_08900 [Microbacterium sp. X-17]|uniref:hypothetical protein n=1 Tax=Microbacterium sp. X-17 TaxID=3144404 RepID=UPI0031F48EF3
MPAELVGTSFVEGGGDSVTSGTVASSEADPSEFETVSLTAVTPTTVSYAWKGYGATYEISKDGAPFLNTTNPVFMDSGLGSGTRVVYQITAYDEQNAVVANRTVPITTPGVGNDFASLARSGVTPLSYQPYNSKAIYRTFISDYRVALDLLATFGCGQAGTNNRTFGGDSRGYALPGSNAPWDNISSRTSVALNINWNNPYPYDIQWVKQIGTTHLYEGDTLIDQRTASDAGIQISDVQVAGSYAQARVNHDVGNPFCSAGSIKYNVVFRWYRNGTFEVVGWRQPVPSHEVWGGWDNGVGNMNWDAFALLGNEGFNCLAGFCGNRTMNYSLTH